MFRSSHFWFLVTFVDEVTNTKILHNLCLHFARQDGQDSKKRIENHATKVTKVPKTIRLNEQNNNLNFMHACFKGKSNYVQIPLFN